MDTRQFVTGIVLMGALAATPAFAQEGRRLRAIAWRAAERASFLERNKAAVNLAFSLEKNEFQGETYLELSVCDFKSPDGLDQ